MFVESAKLWKCMILLILVFKHGFGFLRYHITNQYSFLSIPELCGYFYLFIIIPVSFDEVPKVCFSIIHALTVVSNSILNHQSTRSYIYSVS